MEQWSQDDLDKEFARSTQDSEVPIQDVAVDVQELLTLLRVDGEFFIEFFLAEQLDMEVPGFHKEIWGLLTDQEKERILLAIPRDHAKTTLAKLVVIWYWIFTSHRFCVYLSNTSPIAKGACRDIMGFLDNPNFKQLYRYKMIKQDDNGGLWVFDLHLPNGRVKRCVLRALGQGQQMRGINVDNQRPDIAVVDDVEDNENTESETQQKKLDRWMFGPFLKALARKKKILWLGNMLTKTSLLARLSRNPKWNPVVFGCMVRNEETKQLQPLWPGKWTIESLQEDFKEYKDMGLIESWMCEMMNMPGHGENGFSADSINYQVPPAPDEILAAWITIDPAFGQDSHNDESAISVHVIPHHGPPGTVAVAHGRWDENRLFEEALSLAFHWNAWVWGIEAIAAQRLLIPMFNIFLASRQLMGRVEFIPLMSGGASKTSRIQAWVSLMGNGEWWIPEGDWALTEQITNYDFRKKKQADDRIDSAAYGPLMTEQHLPIIMAQASGQDWLTQATAQYGTEVCGV